MMNIEMIVMTMSEEGRDRRLLTPLNGTIHQPPINGGGQHVPKIGIWSNLRQAIPQDIRGGWKRWQQVMQQLQLETWNGKYVINIGQLTD